jgi:hypothetical protein
VRPGRVGPAAAAALAAGALALSAGAPPAGQAAAARGDDGQPAQRPKPHDLAELYTSGHLDRLGFDYRPATASSIFRHPSSMGLRP